MSHACEGANYSQSLFSMTESKQCFDRGIMDNNFKPYFRFSKSHLLLLDRPW